jgi:hypothetical protein
MSRKIVATEFRQKSVSFLLAPAADGIIHLDHFTLAEL